MSELGEHTERFYFRVIGLLPDQIRFMRNAMPNITIEDRQRKGRNDYVLLIELSSSDICAALRRVLSDNPLNVPFGIYASLVTVSDSDGLSIPQYICSFWREIGGSLDFSFTVV